MNGTPAVQATLVNPEKLPDDDLRVLAGVTYEVRALNDGVTHEPIGDPAGPGLWHHKGQQLPAYIQQVAQALMRSGTPESRAIATAVSRCKVWCAGGQHVTAQTKAKACAAVAEWEKLKAEHTKAGWNPGLHPRVPKGQPGGGRFGQGNKSQAPGNANAVGEGESSGRVHDLQARLNQLGFHLKVDGKFGPETLAAVKKFQSQHEDATGTPLKADGLVGPKTTAALRMKNPVKRKPKTARVHKTTRRKTKKKTAHAATAVPELVTIPGVDLLAAGTWELASGRNTFTRQDIEDAIEASQCPAVGNPVIKLGHVDPRWDGEPAIGKVVNLRASDNGSKLIGDMADMPGWIAAISASAFPRRSIEGAYDFRCQIGHDHPFVLTGLALLGVTAPGVGVLNSLPDIASLYGLTASQARDLTGWQFASDQLEQEGTPMAVTEEDVRRAYYANSGAPKTWWITELQMSPTQLIVAGDDGQLLQVPFTIQDGDVRFGDATPLETYADLTAARGSGHLVTYASAADSRSVEDDEDDDVTAADGTSGESGDDVYADPKNKKYKLNTKAQARVAWAYINMPKNAELYPMNGVTLESVKSAITSACKKFGVDISAAGMYRRLVTLREQLGNRVTAAGDPDDDVKQLLASLDATLDEAAALVPADTSSLPADVGQALALLVGAEEMVDQILDMMGIYDADDDDDVKASDAAQPPEMDGDQVEGNPGNAMMGHGPCGTASGPVTHTHPHPAMGAQGDDKTHSHKHTHKGDATHDHAHATAGAGKRKGDSKVEFTEEQETSLRASLGLGDDEELTPDKVAAAAADLRAQKVRAGAAKLPAGVITIEEEVWKGLNKKVEAAERFRERVLRNERDEVIDQAVREGKFSAARKPHWQRVWDADPEGAREILASLKKNTVPVEDIGRGGGNFDDLEFEDEFSTLWPAGEYKRQGS